MTFPGSPATTSAAIATAAGRPDLGGGRTQQIVDASRGEPGEGLLPRVLGEEAQGGDGQVVVAVPEPGPAGVGEQVLASRTSTPAAAVPGRVAHLDLARLQQRVEMAADGRGRQLQLAGDRRGAARALLHQQPGDRRAGAALGVAHVGARSADSGTRTPWGRVHDRTTAAFHNTNVTYIRVIGKPAPSSPAPG